MRDISASTALSREVVKYYSIGDSYKIKLDLFYIWRLYGQIWISGTNKDMNMNLL
jgi:hypothetical protein